MTATWPTPRLRALLEQLDQGHPLEVAAAHVGASREAARSACKRLLGLPPSRLRARPAQRRRLPPRAVPAGTPPRVLELLRWAARHGPTFDRLSWDEVISGEVVLEGIPTATTTAAVARGLLVVVPLLDPTLERWALTPRGKSTAGA